VRVQRSPPLRRGKHAKLGARGDAAAAQERLPPRNSDPGMMVAFDKVPPPLLLIPPPFLVSQSIS
jgi:hypothetical protein